MGAYIPRQINPIQMAKIGSSISGALSVTDCARLREVLYDNIGEIKVDITFGIDASHYMFMQGKVAASLHLICQRCLKSMNVDIKGTFNFSPVKSEAAAKLLPKQYEPLLMTEKEISLIDLVEDEVLLSLPPVTMHSENECAVTLADFNKKLKQDVSIKPEEKENVFRKLKVLKDSKH